MGCTPTPRHLMSKTALGYDSATGPKEGVGRENYVDGRLPCGRLLKVA
jgi:hypothetical protein